jgi:hypothetical protein
MKYGASLCLFIKYESQCKRKRIKWKICGLYELKLYVSSVFLYDALWRHHSPYLVVYYAIQTIQIKRLFAWKPSARSESKLNNHDKINFNDESINIYLYA